jgi:hypothetical protein
MKKKGKFDYILLETTGLADPGFFPCFPWALPNRFLFIIFLFIIIEVPLLPCFGLMRPSAAQFSWTGSSPLLMPNTPFRLLFPPC